MIYMGMVGRLEEENRNSIHGTSTSTALNTVICSVTTPAFKIKKPARINSDWWRYIEITDLQKLFIVQLALLHFLFQLPPQ